MNEKRGRCEGHGENKRKKKRRRKKRNEDKKEEEEDWKRVREKGVNDMEEIKGKKN